MSILGLDLRYRVRGQDDQFAVQKMSVAFERAGEGFEDFGPTVFPKVSELMEGELTKQFGAEGRGPNRGKWAELTPDYAERKARTHPGKPILERTGALREALTSPASPLAMRVYSGSQFNFGTSGVPYASYHQSGTHHQDGAQRMVDRPMFDFTGDLERGLQNVARESAREVMRGAGMADVATVSE